MQERQGGDVDGEELAGAGTQLLHQKSPLGGGRWRGGYQDRGGPVQTLYFTQAAIQQAADFRYGNLFIVERGQKIQEDVWLGQRGCAFEQGQHLVAGESPPDEGMLQGQGWVGTAATDEPDQMVGGETIAAVQNGQWAAQCQFCHDLCNRLDRSAGSAEDGQGMGLREGKDVHALSIDLIETDKNPPAGEPWGRNGLIGWGRQMLS